MFARFPTLDSRSRLLGFWDPFEDFLRDPWFDLEHHVAELEAPRETQRTGAKAAELKSGETTANSSLMNVNPGTPNSSSLVPNSSSGRDQWLSYARAPAVDIIEKEKEYLVSVDVPGVNKEEIKVNISNSQNGRKVLNVSGERKSEATEEDKARGYRSHSRMFGKFSRSLMLPDNVECDNISAKHDNGVLKISIPKRPEDKRPATQTVQIQ
jgi:HSP20 family molecular chaperone IbpA